MRYSNSSNGYNRLKSYKHNETNIFTENLPLPNFKMETREETAQYRHCPLCTLNAPSDEPAGTESATSSYGQIIAHMSPIPTIREHVNMNNFFLIRLNYCPIYYLYKNCSIYNCVQTPLAKLTKNKLNKRKFRFF